MNDIAASFDSRSPAIVAVKISLNEAEALKSILVNLRAKLALYGIALVKATQAASNPISLIKQLQADVPGEEPSNARHQDRYSCGVVRRCVHRSSL
jgi:hypothetical protein